MARQKKENLTQEELQQKEIEKQKKQEEKEQLLSSCILKSFNLFFSDKELKDFMKKADNLKVSQEDLLYLSISALLNDKIEFTTETKTTLVLK